MPKTGQPRATSKMQTHRISEEFRSFIFQAAQWAEIKMKKNQRPIDSCINNNYGYEHVIKSSKNKKSPEFKPCVISISYLFDKSVSINKQNFKMYQYQLFVGKMIEKLIDGAGNITEINLDKLILNSYTTQFNINIYLIPKATNDVIFNIANQVQALLNNILIFAADCWKNRDPMIREYITHAIPSEESAGLPIEFINKLSTKFQNPVFIRLANANERKRNIHWNIRYQDNHKIQDLRSTLETIKSIADYLQCRETKGEFTSFYGKTFSTWGWLPQNCRSYSKGLKLQAASYIKEELAIITNVDELDKFLQELKQSIHYAPLQQGRLGKAFRESVAALKEQLLAAPIDDSDSIACNTSQLRAL